MIRRPPRSTLDRSAAASDGYKRQGMARVTVGAATPTVVAVTVSGVGANATVGQTVGLSATAQFSDGTASDITTQASWDSSNTAVATVSQSGSVNFVAVSYTHLRAHETVLDLVCRLLLEKKKR